MKKINSWFLRSILLLATYNGFTQSREEIIEQKIDSLFTQYTHETPGVSVAVIDNGKTIFKKGYGSANLEYSIPIAAQTVFLVGSVSKQFTAFSIYLLQHQGKLSLDDDIRKYIPELPNFEKPITIRHLCYHTSGLKEQLALLSFSGWRMDEYISNEQILKVVNRQKELTFDPGSKFQYSNTNYTLLAEIVERVSGERFSSFTKKNIFEPLGMNNSQFYDDHEKLIKNRAYSYDYEDGFYEKEILNNVYLGPTGLYTTVEDLSKWSNNFYTPKVGDELLLKKFNKPATLDNGKPALLSEELNIQHAKGQFLRNYRGVNTYIHTGSDAAFKAFFGRFPEKKLTVIVLSNDMFLEAYPIGIQIAEFYLEEEMLPKQQTTNSPTNTDNDSTVFTNKELSNYVGDYYSAELLTNYKLLTKEGKLVMSHLRLNDIRLDQTGQSKFSGVNYYPFTLEFIKDEKGLVIGFNITDFRGETLPFKKCKNYRHLCIDEK